MEESNVVSRRGILRGGVGAVVATGLGVTVSGLVETPAQAAQRMWRWCELCGALWFSGSTDNGYCPVGTGFLGLDHSHHQNGSADYVLKEFPETDIGWSGWNWCRACGCLWHPMTYSSRCARNGTGGHTSAGSGNYLLEYTGNTEAGATLPGQNQWRFCYACCVLYYSGNAAQHNVCPATGGQHALDISGTLDGRDYHLRHF